MEWKIGQTNEYFSGNSQSGQREMKKTNWGAVTIASLFPITCKAHEGHSHNSLYRLTMEEFCSPSNQTLCLCRGDFFYHRNSAQTYLNLNAARMGVLLFTGLLIHIDSLWIDRGSSQKKQFFDRNQTDIVEMGRAAQVSEEHAVAVIGEFIEHFKSTTLPDHASRVWGEMATWLQTKDKNNTWRKHNVYINVREDRRKILTKARALHRIEISPEIPDISLDDSTQLEASHENENDEGDENYEMEIEAKGLDRFMIVIARSDWSKMRGLWDETPHDKNRGGLIKDVWESVLAEAIFLQLRFPCAYIFKHIDIYDRPNSLHYMRITGCCKGKECKNPLFAYVYKNPGDSDLELTIRTHNTQYDREHEQVTRPCRGVIRKRVGAQVFHEGSANWRRRRIGESTKLGEMIPPTIPSLATVQATKQDFIDERLEATSEDGKDIVVTIVKMQNRAEYSNSILDLNPRPFFVTFSIPSQRHAYSRYHQTMTGHSMVGVDGTGTAVGNFTRPDGTKSGHIFYYPIVINFEGQVMPVHGMYTESQSTQTFRRFFEIWIHPPRSLQKLPKPSQLVCDDSRALLNGSCLALNEQSISTYVDTCFLYASNHPEFRYRPIISTYIRLDVAHLVKMVMRWDSTKQISLKVVRRMYKYCLGLLIDCQTLASFEEIFLLICTLGLHECQDDIIVALPGNKTVLHARQALENKIALRTEEFFKKDVDEEEDKVKPKKDFFSDSTAEPSRSHIREWIDNIVERAGATIGPDHPTEPNAFYAPSLISELTKLCYEFPLFTTVGMPFFADHASTSFTEGYFNLWKHNERKDYSSRLRLDKSLKLDLQNSREKVKAVEGKLSEFASQGQWIESPMAKNPRAERINEFPGDSCSISSILDESPKTNIPNATDSEVHVSQDEEQSDSCENDDTAALDNWRNKGIERTQMKLVENIHDDPIKLPKGKDCSTQQNQKSKKKKGTSFMPNPEISHQNRHLNDVQKGLLLQNGNKTGVVNLDDGSYFILGTCHYDVIVQILMCLAYDDKQFEVYMNNHLNPTFKFVTNLMKDGKINRGTYEKRGIILRDLFKNRRQIQVQTKIRIVSYEIVTNNNCSETWNLSLPEFPSILISYNCSQCGHQKQRCQSTLFVTHKTIQNHGFGALKDYISSYFGTEEAKCSLCKTAACTVTRRPNFMIFVELDIRSYDLNEKLCRIRDVPPILELEKQYRLAGVIEYKKGTDDTEHHYIAHCRRSDRRWQTYNDIEVNVLPGTTGKQIVSHAAVYMVDSFEASTVFEGTGTGYTVELDRVLTETSCDNHINLGSLDDFSEIIPASTDASFEDPLGPINNPNSHQRMESKKTPATNLQTNIISDGNPPIQSAQNIHQVDPTPNSHDHRVKSTGVPSTNVPTELIPDDPPMHSEEEIDLIDPVLNSHHHTVESPEVPLPDIPIYIIPDGDQSMHSTENLDSPPNYKQIEKILSCVKLVRTKYFIRNSSTFDCVIQMLAAVADENPIVRDFMATSTNEILKLVTTYLNSIDVTAFSLERASFFKTFFAHKVRRRHLDIRAEYEINMYAEIVHIWAKCMHKNPSLLQEYQCLCSEYTKTVSVLKSDNSKMFGSNFKGLEKVLDVYEKLYRVQCSKCSGLCTVTYHYNSLVLVDLSCTNSFHRPKRCQLGDIQKLLTLTVPYRLSSVIAPNEECEDVVFYRRTDGMWMLLEKLFQPLKEYPQSTVVTPRVALYVPEEGFT